MKVTGVSLDGTCGGPVVRYEVLDVCPSHLDTMVTSLETRYTYLPPMLPPYAIPLCYPLCYSMMLSL